MSEIDELMSLDPLHLSSQDIDKIIAYQRKQKQNFELGIKPKKEKGSVNLDNVLSALKVSAPAAPAVKITRRI